MTDQPQDIFQDVEPITPTPTSKPSYVKPIPQAAVPIPEVRGVQLHRSRWPLLVGGAIVLLIGIAAAVVFVRRSAPAPVANTPAKDVNAAVNVAAVGTNTQAEQVVASPDIVTNDKDRDGLTDEEEQKLGTKDTVADTDGDALSDYDEVKVYKTNPLKPDTDGDGNPDGAEVKKGYNPNGTGMLLDFEAARQKLTP